MPRRYYNRIIGHAEDLGSDASEEIEIYGECDEHSAIDASTGMFGSAIHIR